MSGGWWQYLGVFIASVALSLVLTPLAIGFALRTGSLDRPSPRKRQAEPVPYLGGVAIVLAFSLAVVVASMLDSSTNGDAELLKVLAIALCLAGLGLLDDLRGVPVSLRLVVGLAAAVVLWSLDLGTKFVGNSTIDLMVTVLWVVGLVNAFNMVDNMDGLSAGLSAIAASSFFAVAGANGQFLVAGLSAGLAGCALGFLRHNVHPAKIYMGDAGAYFFGFMIAYVGLKLQFDSDVRDNTFLVPVVACSVVIADTTLVTLTRVLSRRSPFAGGLDHSSHRLVKVGLPVPVAVGLIHAAAISAGVVAYVIARVDEVSGWILAALCGGLLATFGILLARVPVEASSDRTLYRITRVETD